MKVVLQRVRSSSVLIDQSERRSIGEGMTVLLGITEGDSQKDIDWLVRKMINMRIYPDDTGVMNRSILETGGSFLVISQFTLHASTKKGNRPSYIRSAAPSISKPLYEAFLETLEKESGLEVQKGEFGADMLVEIQNDGPVTIIMDTEDKK